MFGKDGFMQRDFHYYVIRILSEKAGFSPKESQILAYTSQYVDDAVEHKKIQVKNIPSLNYFRYQDNYFDPTCTAHKSLQYLTGLQKQVQRSIYIPFHFIPSQSYNLQGNYDYVCKAGGTLAIELVEQALRALSTRDLRLCSLIKLGIALHSYADTWAHQGFSGRHSSYDNDIDHIKIRNGIGYKKLPFLEQLFRNLVPDIGHAEAGSFPDQSHLQWQFEKDHQATFIKRNNTQIFMEAARNIYQIMCRFNQRESEWYTFAPKLQACLSLQTEDEELKEAQYSRFFPEINFHYNHLDWRRQALRGERFNWEDFHSKDYYHYQYSFNGDYKWFYFHIEAMNQRQFVLQRLKLDLR